jgi:hypothetical protein
MKDLSRSKDEMLTQLSETNSRHLKESYENLENLIALLPLAKNARERTTLNIILDDQKKVVKSLKRLADDLLEIVD